MRYVHRRQSLAHMASWKKKKCLSTGLCLPPGLHLVTFQIVHSASESLLSAEIMHNWTYRSYLKTLRLSSKRLLQSTTGEHHEKHLQNESKAKTRALFAFHVVRLNRERCPFPLFTSVTLLSSLDFNGTVQRLVYYMATIKKISDLRLCYIDFSDFLTA